MSQLRVYECIELDPNMEKKQDGFAENYENRMRHVLAERLTNATIIAPIVLYRIIRIDHRLYSLGWYDSEHTEDEWNREAKSASSTTFQLHGYPDPSMLETIPTANDADVLRIIADRG